MNKDNKYKKWVNDEPQIDLRLYKKAKIENYGEYIGKKVHEKRIFYLN